MIIVQCFQISLEKFIFTNSTKYLEYDISKDDAILIHNCISRPGLVGQGPVLCPVSPHQECGALL